jgi:hypothetical protein
MLHLVIIGAGAITAGWAGVGIIRITITSIGIIGDTADKSQGIW